MTNEEAIARLKRIQEDLPEPMSDEEMAKRQIDYARRKLLADRFADREALDIAIATLEQAVWPGA
jgi:hypothetical protein